MRSKVLLGLLLCTCATATFASGANYKTLSEWEKTDFSTTTIDSGQVNPSDATKLRGIIFGKHGRVFKEKDIQHFLESRPWYHPNPSYTNAVLSPTEKTDLDTVRGIESEQHSSVQPGDLRFYMDRELDESEITKDLTSIHIIKAEIEAIHGKTFPEEPEMQKYFEDRYWYKSDPTYNSKQLNEKEKKNLEVLSKLEQKVHGAEVGPGDMPLFKDHALKESQLKNISLYDLRLMRNEFYALHGYQFKTPWLQRHFGMMDWYKPSKEVDLSPVEKQNVLLIVTRENQIHEGLSSAPIDKSLLEGLFIEDLRKLKNEIYARHGMVFHDKWLRGYFSSFPWYHPNPHFSTASLSKTERENLHLITSLSTNAESAMNAEEG